MSPTYRRRGPLIGAREPIAALNRVRITELDHPWEMREPLVDIRAFCPGVVLHDWVCPYLRAAVADRLNQAQANLPAGYRLKVGTALRTLQMQSSGWDAYFDRMRTEHPQWPLSALRRATNKYFAPYDQKAPPGHCTGGAVDVGLLDPSGAALDLTAPTQGWEGAYTWSDRISPEARANRMLMVEAMRQAGFSNCRDEFWHYSWGDSAWAVRTGISECPYGWTHAPVTLDTEFEGAYATDLAMVTERNAEGRPVNARLSCAYDPRNGAAPFKVRINWANGVPVHLTLAWPSDAAVPCLYMGDGKEAWAPLEQVERSPGYVDIYLVPDADRVQVTGIVPQSG